MMVMLNDAISRDTSRLRLDIELILNYCNSFDLLTSTLLANLLGVNLVHYLF
jgi:hypothetical protein